MDLPARAPLVLIVDDNAESRAMYARYLSLNGCQVAEAAHGFQGVDKAFKLCPDAIVMDLLMPNLDGWEAMRLLRNRTCTRQTPIIALTGDSHIEHLKLARNAGCDVVLLKPCAPEVVFEEIRRLVAARHPDRATRTPEAPARPR
jgi:CheY-like chemotaxis protein